MITKSCKAQQRPADNANCVVNTIQDSTRKLRIKRISYWMQ